MADRLTKEEGQDRSNELHIICSKMLIFTVINEEKRKVLVEWQKQ